MLERLYKKPGRNGICPCGSELKFKNCECYTNRKADTYLPNDKVASVKLEKSKKLQELFDKLNVKPKGEIND